VTRAFTGDWLLTQKLLTTQFVKAVEHRDRQAHLRLMASSCAYTGCHERKTAAPKNVDLHDAIWQKGYNHRG
jgi:hypothetical protein